MGVFLAFIVAVAMSLSNCIFIEEYNEEPSSQENAVLTSSSQEIGFLLSSSSTSYVPLSVPQQLEYNDTEYSYLTTVRTTLFERLYVRAP